MRSNSGPEILDWYSSAQRGAREHARDASSRYPQRHGRVAFLPFGSILLKSHKPRFEPAAPSTIGEHLKQRRLDLGLRQIDVAHQLEVNEHSIVKWEAGRTPLDRYIPRIIEFLGYDPRPEPRTLAERLIWKRQALGLPRKTAARLLGIDEGSLARWEWGVRQPSGIRRDKVNRFLNVRK
jgi:DNA-binding transcriptional regulator YiaG